MRRGPLALLALAAGCGGPADAAPAALAQGIVAGSPSPHEAAVALVARRVRCAEPAPHLLCSGALVAPDLVLTAAHCLDVFGAEGPYEVFAGATLPDGTWVRVREARAHPAYVPATHAFDVALLRLAAPLDVEPFVLATAAPRVGDTARAVGFGDTRDGAPAGMRLQGDTAVVDVLAAAFRAGPSPSMSCTGDSGGPVLIDGRLAGITVSGDVACRSEAVAVRVDALGDFLGPALAERQQPAPAAAFDPAALCAERCGDAADCPAGLLCEPGADGVGRCLLPALQDGSFGPPCADDAACGAGSTCARLEGDDCRCFTPCAAVPQPGAPAPRGGGCATADASAPAGLLGLLALLRRGRGPRPTERAPGRRSVGAPNVPR